MLIRAALLFVELNPFAEWEFETAIRLASFRPV